MSRSARDYFVRRAREATKAASLDLPPLPWRPFKRQRWMAAAVVRNHTIWLLHGFGWSNGRIARAYQLSPQRVQQIVASERRWKVGA